MALEDLLKRDDLPEVVRELIRAEIAERASAADKQHQIDEADRVSFEHSPVCMGRADLDGTITAANRNFCALLGYVRDELIGKRTHDITHPDDLGVTAAQLDKMGEVEGTRFSMEKRYLRKDGRPVWVDLFGVTILDTNGAPDHIEFALHNITERKLAEEALRESEKRFRTIIENTDAGYFFIDKEGLIQDVNKAWLRMYGYSTAGEILGEHFAVIQQAEDTEAAKEFVAGIMHGDTRYMTGEFSRKCQDGNVGYHTFSAKPVMRYGAVAGIEGFIIDTTARKLAEEALREAQQQLLSVISAVPIVLWAIDNDGTFLVSEGKGLEALGLQPGDVVGQSVFDLYKEYPEAIASIRRGLTGEESSGDVEVAGRRWDNRYMPQRDERGEISGLAATSLDVTDQRNAEEERRTFEAHMQQTQKLESLGILAGGIAHDFNNLLVGMLGHSDLALSKLPPENPARPNIEGVMHAAERAADLSRQMLAY